MAKSAAERQRERRQRKNKAGLTEVLLTLDAEAMDILKERAIDGKTLSVAACELFKSKSSSKHSKINAGSSLITPEQKKKMDGEEGKSRDYILKKLRLEKEIEEQKNKSLELMLELAKHGRTVSDFEADEDGVYRVRD